MSVTKSSLQQPGEKKCIFQTAREISWLTFVDVPSSFRE